MTEKLVAPFPYFGGKRRIAPKVWDLLGDVRHYVEPFCGSLAVLLARPNGHQYRCETVNDKDGWVTNVWRAIQHDPETTAYYATGPVSEIDYHAQLAWLQARREDFVPLLEGDPEFFDAKAAGWWLRVTAAGIGNPFNVGPWRVVDGRLVNTRDMTDAAENNHGINRELPHLTGGRGVNRELPHLTGSQGVNRGLQKNENFSKGIRRALPHIGNSGRGVNRVMGDYSSPKQEKIESTLMALSARIENTRITTGDWKRILTNSPIHGGFPTSRVGVFLDPPYEIGTNLYAVTATGNHTISQEVRHWCSSTAQPWVEAGMKIILCGYENEHDELLDYGWTKTLGAHTTGGYAKDKTREGKTEQLWLSPSITNPDTTGMLF